MVFYFYKWSPIYDYKYIPVLIYWRLVTLQLLLEYYKLTNNNHSFYYCLFKGQTMEVPQKELKVAYTYSLFVFDFTSGVLRNTVSVQMHYLIRQRLCRYSGNRSNTWPLKAAVMDWAGLLACCNKLLCFEHANWKKHYFKVGLRKHKLFNKQYSYAWLIIWTILYLSYLLSMSYAITIRRNTREIYFDISENNTFYL